MDADGTAAQANSAEQLSDQILASYTAQRGAGPITFRAFLSSSGSTPCSVREIAVNGTP